MSSDQLSTSGARPHCAPHNEHGTDSCFTKTDNLINFILGGEGGKKATYSTPLNKLNNTRPIPVPYANLRHLSQSCCFLMAQSASPSQKGVFPTAARLCQANRPHPLCGEGPGPRKDVGCSSSGQGKEEGDPLPQSSGQRRQSWKKAVAVSPLLSFPQIWVQEE